MVCDDPVTLSDCAELPAVLNKYAIGIAPADGAFWQD